MIIDLSHYCAAFGLTMIGCVGCAYAADKLVFTRFGRLIAGSFAVALSLSAIGILLYAVQTALR